MQTTAEVRWFYRGGIPAEVAAWFADGAGPIEHQPPRVDEYLVVRETDSVNVKFREGRIEIKQRYGDTVTRGFSGGSVGTVEFWRKWGFGVGRGNSNGNLNGIRDTWLAVRKDRMARAYALQPDGTVTPLADLLSVDHGCSLELTEVVAGGEQWWSLCFEELGPAEHLMKALVDVADQVLATFEDFRFTADASCGYSAWLQRFPDPVHPT
jgi:hypothetical protein